MVGYAGRPQRKDGEEAAWTVARSLGSGGGGRVRCGETLTRIAVVGGAGSFGQSLVRGLLETTDCHVVVCGRTRERTYAFLRELKAGDRASAAFLDRGRATASDIAKLEAFCVVDAAGPFQASNYALARAAIDAGVHYIDLADARDFVAGFGTLDEAAKARAVLAVTGASSTPALSQAVLDEICRDWKRVDEVEIAISPGGQAPLGLSVVRAILSYAGKPVNVWRHGRWEDVPGWGLLKRVAIQGLGKRFVSLVETPDLDIVRMRFPTVRSAVFRAGVELSILHLGLSVLARAVRAGILPTLERSAELLHAVAGWFRRFGSDRGAMTVEAVGRDQDGARLRKRWTLIADAGDGPNIPALPALALVRALCEGRVAQRGATAMVGILPLGAFVAEFARFEIRTDTVSEPLSGPSLFQRALTGFAAMPAALRDAHVPDPARELHGEVEIKGPENPFGHAIAWMVGFPHADGRVPASVTIEREGDGEIWIRRFGASTFSSRLTAGGENRVVERFGPLQFDLGAQADARGFTLSILGGRLGELPWPKFLTPITKSTTDVDENGRYRFDVAIALPVIGRLVQYRGWLTPA